MPLASLSRSLGILMAFPDKAVAVDMWPRTPKGRTHVLSVSHAAMLSSVLVVVLIGSRSPGTTARQNAGHRSFSGSYCGYDSRGAMDELSNHEQNASRRGKDAERGGFTTAAARPSSAMFQDVGDIAMVEDDGTFVIQPNKFRLKNQSLLFVPDVEGYRASTSELEFSDDVGSRLGTFLGADNKPGDADNGYRDIALAGARFPFYGTYYDTIYVGTNGYITFTQGDTTARISPAALASELPRVAPLWSDLEFVDSGNIYYNRLDGRRLITWSRGAQPLYSGTSTFQAVLYDDGRIAFVYAKVKVQAALVGLSPGRSTLDPRPIDLSSPPSEAITGPFFETFAKDLRLDLPALMRAFYRTHSDSFDTAFVWTNFDFDNGLGVARSFNIRNDIAGIGIRRFERGPAYGSPERLSTMITMGNEANWPANPQALTAGLNTAICIVCHELGHRWLAYVRFEDGQDTKDDLLGRDNAHWSFLADTRTNTDGSHTSLMEGNAWSAGGASTFTTVESSVNYFTRLDQYLMGLRSAEEIGEIAYLDTTAELKDFLRARSPVSGFSMSAARKTTSVSKIIEREGARVPDAVHSAKAFRVAFILLTAQGSAPAAATLETITRYRDSLIDYFAVATEGRASLDGSLKQHSLFKARRAFATNASECCAKRPAAWKLAAGF